MSDEHKFPFIYPSVNIAGDDLPGMTFNIPPNGVGIYLYNTDVAIAIGEIVTVVFGSTDRQEIAFVDDPPASTDLVISAVALEAVAASKIGRFQLFGECQALVQGGTDVAVDNYLEVKPTTNYLVKDTGGNCTSESIAIAKQAYVDATSALKTIWLMACPHLVTA